METPIPVFGKNIIEMLMFNMYDECKVIYREYIQNSFDAIQQAVSLGILSGINEGMVNVNIDEKHRNIVVLDNCTGIPMEKAASTLLNVAASEKDGISQAGQYGVGRLVGAGFCSRIIFRTKAAGEIKGTEVIIDSNMAHSIVRDRNDHRDAIAVMSAISSVKEIECPEDHFFEVTLEGIREGYDELLSEKEIISYLSSVAPVDYSTTFKHMLINECPEFVEKYPSIKNVQITINNKEVKKNYGLEIIGNNDKILGLDVFDIKDDEQQYAWGWIAETPITGEIPEYNKFGEYDINRGIRLRKNNIQIGDAKLLDKFFRESRGNHYFYGEIHIINNCVVPDSTRQGLAITTETLCFYEALRNKFSELYKIYRTANELKSAVKKLSVAIKNEQSDDPNVDKVQAKSEVKTALNVFEKAETKDITSTGAGHEILRYYQDLSKEVINNGGSISVEPLKPKTIHHTQTLVATDELSPLATKFSGETIKAIKKIFALFRKKATDKASLENIIADIIKQLSK